MKTIGLIGGMSWESTVTYYELLNEGVKEALGGLHSAKILLCSVDFDEIEALQSSGDWDKAGSILAGIAQKLEHAGADAILIRTNTMHKVADTVAAAISVPLLHIAAVTAEALLERGITSTALLGTRYTMTEDFYKSKLTERGIRVLIPEEEDVDAINDIIFKELCLGVISEASREKMLAVIEMLTRKGAESVILGCTEIGLLISQADTSLPVFDTTRIHAAAAVRFALG
jgi:aspartate racemase